MQIRLGEIGQQVCTMTMLSALFCLVSDMSAYHLYARVDSEMRVAGVRGATAGPTSPTHCINSSGGKMEAGRARDHEANCTCLSDGAPLCLC